MQSTEKPKRRMVVYVTEETYASLQDIAKAESRSVSNVAEGKIIVGLRAGPDRTDPGRAEAALTGQDRTGLDSEELKSSVIDVLDNLPVESLTHLAEKLAQILDRSLPVQTVPKQIGKKLASVHETRDAFDIDGVENKRVVMDIAVRLSDFVKKNHLSQRRFRELYKVDLTSLRFWLTGQRGMRLQMIHKIEKILLSDPDTI